MSDTVHLAVDLMGGDFGLRSSLPGALAALDRDSHLSLTLFAPDAELLPLLAGVDRYAERLQHKHAPSVVAMDERPGQALRHKSDSSMRLALDFVQAGSAAGVVSAGNTGALMAMGGYVLKTLVGIDRPAICSALPTLDGHCHMLDLGANVDSSAEQLHQFAVMGSALASAIDGLTRPRIALLNIGEENVKGNEQVKQAAALFKNDSTLNFCGFIEGSGLYLSQADVVVCDGFVGNVALKVCEGTARLVSARIKRRFESSLYGRISALLMSPVLRELRRELDPEQYNGALLLGLQGIVVKAHGGSSALGFQRAIELAARAVRTGLIQKIDTQLSRAGRGAA